MPLIYTNSAIKVLNFWQSANKGGATLVYSTAWNNIYIKCMFIYTASKYEQSPKMCLGFVIRLSEVMIQIINYVRYIGMTWRSSYYKEIIYHSFIKQTKQKKMLTHVCHTVSKKTNKSKLLKKKNKQIKIQSRQVFYTFKHASIP